MSRARELSKLANPAVFSVDSSNNVGLNSVSPDAKLDVIGIVSATAFYGDGSNLEGVASAGLGTALADEGALSVIYYTDNELTVGSTITVNPPDSTNVAYTQYAEIVVSDDADLIVAPGDDFIPDVLGLSTEGVSPLAGSGGRVRADSFTNHAGTGAPTFNAGLQVTGVATATTFDGNLTGNVTGNVTGTEATFSGSVSVGGTLTYQDVTNIDSVGIITANSGIRVGAGQSISPVSGTITYYGDGSNLTGIQAGVWTQIDSQQISSSTAQVDVIFGANAGITTAYAQIKVYYDVWLNSADKLYVRGAHGFSGTFANDVKTTNYYYSGFWHRAGETAMNFPTQGENASDGLISANNNKEHHNGEMIISNAAGRLYTTTGVNWPALVYNTQGYTGGDTDAHNFTISGHLKGGDNSPLQGIRIYSGQNIIAGEVRTYGLTA